MQFIKIIGGASTTAWDERGRNLGHDVNPVLYADGEARVVKLESGGRLLRGYTYRFPNQEDYEAWVGDTAGAELMIKGIELFGCRTSWSKPFD